MKRRNPQGRMLDENQGRWRVLSAYFALTYAAFLVNTGFYLKYPVIDGTIQCIYLASVWLTYSFLYLAAPMAMIAAWNSITTSPMARRMGLSRLPVWLVLGAPAVLLLGGVHLYFFANRFVYGLYKFHLHSGFIRNLVLTRGGLESMGSDTTTSVTVGSLTAGFIGLQWALFALALRSRSSHSICAAVKPRSVDVSSDTKCAGPRSKLYHRPSGPSGTKKLSLYTAPSAIA